MNTRIRRIVGQFVKQWSVMMIVVMLVSLLSVGCTAPGPARSVQPELLALAEKNPDGFVRVIVQKRSASDAAEQLVTELGGMVVQDLGLINAFAAEVPAKAITQFADSNAVRWVSLDAPMRSMQEDLPNPPEPDAAIDASRQVNVYNQVIGADRLWNQDSKLNGKGVAVAVVDSGVYKTGDLPGSQLVEVDSNRGYHDSKDRYGHGTFVAGVIAGNGNKSHGLHIGVAPKARIISVKVSDDIGSATASSVVAGLQWVYENVDKYNIRVVNLSLNSSVAAPYETDPLCAAVEMLWLRGIVVVVSAGNSGTAPLYPPANDPFVITVGATDDAGTPELDDDTVASFSAYGTTELGFSKPDLVAPGKNIIAFMPGNKNLRIAEEHQLNRVTDHYFRMSGTSVSAPMVSGAVALLLQDEPNLTPDQVKHRLMVTANNDWPGYDSSRAGAGYLDIYAAVYGSSTESANLGVPVSRWLWESLASTVWSSVNWNSVNWNSVNWNSVNWNSVNWNSVNWNSVNWNSCQLELGQLEQRLLGRRRP